MAKTLVLLHGWGGDSSTWEPLLPLLKAQLPTWNLIPLDLPGFGEEPVIEKFELIAVLDALAEKIPTGSLVVGWSLGAMLGVQLSLRFPQKISGLFCLAANAKFVADDSYPTAMSLPVNQQFNTQFQENPLPTLKLFSGLLAQGDENERALLKQLRASISSEAIKPVWNSALTCLSTLDNRAALQSLAQPCLHLLAENDALVPVAAAEALRQINPAHQVHVLPHCAHALHWSRPALVADFIAQFAATVLGSKVIDKKKIAQAFGRAASSYDSLAHFQQRLGLELVEYLPEVERPQVVLDLGCGTGFCVPALRNRYPHAKVFGLDLSETMLIHARKSVGGDFTCVAGDAEFLPFADNSVDLIFSNLVVQWCSSVDRLMQELKRVLKPGGQLIFSTLVERSLHELAYAWAQVDAKVHVNSFHSMANWNDSLQQYFAIQQLDNSLRVEQFADLKTLTQSIKGIGAKNLNQGRPQGLSGRARIQAFVEVYETFRVNGLLPLTYDVLIASVQKTSA